MLITSRYVSGAPSDLNAFHLFPGTWSSRVPGISSTGLANLFRDERVKWCLSSLDTPGDVLELGPLEGGHTWQLEQAGWKVTAVEANELAFIKCLLTKNYLGMKAKFVLGDFTEGGFITKRKWDLVFASGVLYHMADPVSLLKDISMATDRIFLWTHYFEPDLSLWNESVRHKVGTKWLVDSEQIISVGNHKIRIVPQLYEEALGWAGFCGGPKNYSSWVYKDDLLNLLKVLGFSKLEVGFDDPGHVNGPSFAVLASK